MSGKLTYSEDAIFESVKASAGLNVAKFNNHTTSKSISNTITIHNTRGNATYVMYDGVTHYYGRAAFYDCVADSKNSSVGTVQVTHRAP